MWEPGGNDWKNRLYYGDNLKVIREHLSENELFDLIYIDPPFSADPHYSQTWYEDDGSLSKAQANAFYSSWHWDEQAENIVKQIHLYAPDKVAMLIEALKEAIGRDDLMAYVATMTIRLVEFHRLLKPTGTLWIHGDWKMNHYLKIVMDALFGRERQINEIAWKRCSSKNNARNMFGRIHDSILVYSKSSKYYWKQQYVPYTEKQLKAYKYDDKDGRGKYSLNTLKANSSSETNPTVTFKGATFVSAYNLDDLNKKDKEGIIVQNTPGTVPYYKKYLEESKGVPFQDMLVDLVPKERSEAGFPHFITQKPEGLLELILATGCPKAEDGGVFLDPYCGSGTSIAVAEKFPYFNWVAIEVAWPAIPWIVSRIGEERPLFQKDYEIDGVPEDYQHAKQLALNDRYGFQFFMFSKVAARPLRPDEKKKGGDRGVDGMIKYLDASTGKIKKCVVSVKSGKTVKPEWVRELKGTMETQKGSVGCLITLEEPTKEMRTEALASGYLDQDGKMVPKVQILSARDILEKGYVVQLLGNRITE